MKTKAFRKNRNLNTVMLLAPFLLFVFLISGCARGVAIGKKFDMSMASGIKKGVTTKNDILAMFGEPYTKNQGAYGETWMYSYQESRSNSLELLKYAYLGGTATYNATSQSLQITFKGDVVQDYFTNETKM